MARSRTEPDDSPDAADAEARVEAAQEALREAQQEAADASSGLQAAKTRNVPTMTVEVMPDSMISHNDKAYYGKDYPLAPEGHKSNDTLDLDGPTALALLQTGHVTIKGAAS